MNCSKKVALCNAIAVSVTLPKLTFSGVGVVLVNQPGQRNVTTTRLIEMACDIARERKVLCITMGLCIFGRYNARHGGTACRVVSFHA
jgi:hypothetical protein